MMEWITQNPEAVAVITSGIMLLCNHIGAKLGLPIKWVVIGVTTIAGVLGAAYLTYVPEAYKIGLQSFVGLAFTIQWTAYEILIKPFKQA